MKVLVQPRLQVENWSLYWKESLQTKTQCLPPLELDLPDGATPTVGALLAAHEAAQRWQPAGSLVRLDGFSAPWERVLLRGRELSPEQTLEEAVKGAGAGVGEGPVAFTIVRTVLKADGWKIRQPDDFLTDTDSEDEDEDA